jgi:hypothetical protein
MGPKGLVVPLTIYDGALHKGLVNEVSSSLIGVCPREIADCDALKQQAKRS